MRDTSWGSSCTLHAQQTLVDSSKTPPSTASTEDEDVADESEESEESEECEHADVDGVEDEAPGDYDGFDVDTNEFLEDEDAAPGGGQRQES